MKAKHFLFASFAIASTAKAANITDFNYTLTGKDQLVGDNFANAISAATKLSQEDQGCNFASRKVIYAFEDSTIYVSVDGKKFNAFENSTLLAKGCYVPNQDSYTTYSGLRPLAPGQRFDLTKAQSAPTLADVSLALSEQTTIVPSSLAQAIKDGIPATQRQMGCSLPTQLPFIFLFADAAVFTSSDLTQYAAFPLDNFRASGCIVPAMLASKPDEIAGVRFQEGDFLAKYALGGPVSSSYLDQNYTNDVCAGSWKWTDSIPSFQTTLSFDQVNFVAKPKIKKWVDAGELISGAISRYELKIARGVNRESNSGDTLNTRSLTPEEVRAECDSFAAKIAPRQYQLNDGISLSIQYSDLSVVTKPLAEWCSEKVLFIRTGSNQAVDLNDICNDDLRKQIAANANNEVPNSNLGYRPELGRVPMSFETSKSDLLRAVFTQDGKEKYIGTLGEGIPGEFTSSLSYLPRTDEKSDSYCVTSSKGYLCRNWASWIENFSCKVNVTARKLIPVIAPVSIDDYQRVSPPSSNNVVGVTISRNLNPRNYPDSTDSKLAWGLISKDTANKNRPLYQPDPSQRIKDYLATSPVDAASLISTREDSKTWTCSSGDHLPANNVEEARVKYQYMMAQIEQYIRNVDITNYYLTGYCEVGKPCNLDSKPEFAGMIRNLRAFLIEKGNLFTDIQERISVSSSIESIITRFKNSYYEGQKPNGSIGE